MWFMLDLGPIIKILGEPYDMERFRIYRYWSWGKSSPVPRHRFSVLGFQQPTSGCHPIWPLWTRNSLPPSWNWRTTDKGDLFHSNTRILGQNGRSKPLWVCVSVHTKFSAKHISLYIQKAEGPLKHSSLHTPAQTLFGPHLHLLTRVKQP